MNKKILIFLKIKISKNIFPPLSEEKYFYLYPIITQCQGIRQSVQYMPFIIARA